MTGSEFASLENLLFLEIFGTEMRGGSTGEHFLALPFPSFSKPHLFPDPARLAWSLGSEAVTAG